MAVAYVTQVQVAPGRAQEANALFSEAKKIHERLGARARLFIALVAGPNAAIRSYVVEVDDLEAWGRLLQAQTTDAEFQALVSKAFGADSPTTLISISALTEIPI